MFQTIKRIKPNGLTCCALLGVALSLLLLAGCDQEPTAMQTQVSTTVINGQGNTIVALDDWQARWLRGIPCYLPCWEGITPGKTTDQEAHTLIHENPRVMQQASIEPSPLRFDDAYLTASPEPVRNISPNYYVSFKLGDIIAVYGEPTYIEVRTTLDRHRTDGTKFNSYSISALWSSKGFSVAGFYDVTKPAITPELPVSSLYIFVPTTSNDFRSSVYMENPVVWEGYKSYDYYCGEKHQCERIEVRM
jgi:hypothetical protein